MGRHVLIGVTGSVAAIKVPEIVRILRSRCVEVQVILTENAQHFVTAQEFRDLGVTAYTDEGEWKTWKQKGDPILHIELRRWASLFVIVPLDANTLAKLAHGICDNLLTCVARIYEPDICPIRVYPAMNTRMWEHPLTRKQLDILESFQFQIGPPIEKELACGLYGMGGLPLTAAIADEIYNRTDYSPLPCGASR